jgi:hypothetical protein
MPVAKLAVMIRASPDAVWAVLRDFANIDWYSGVELVEYRGRSRRVSSGGMIFDDTLMQLDDGLRRLEYRTTGPGDFEIVNAVVVSATREGDTVVTWTSTTQEERRTRRLQQRVPIILAGLKAHCEAHRSGPRSKRPGQRAARPIDTGC